MEGARAQDAELVERLRAGDEQAFAGLVDELTPALMRMALMYVPSRAIAEEVVAGHLARGDPGDRPVRGAIGAAHVDLPDPAQQARTRGQREKRALPFSSLRRQTADGGDEPAVDADRFQGSDGVRPGWWSKPPVEWEGADQRLESNETRDVLLHAIAALPPRQRDVIVLRDVQGYSAEEARNVLDVSETNQRVLLHRARSKVRAALEEHFEAGQAVGAGA